MDLAWSHDYCTRIFGAQYSTPNITATNEYYGGLNISGSNIMLVTANEDPWQYAGLLDRDPVKQRDLMTYHINCTDCSHCIDLHGHSPSDPVSLQEARGVTRMAIRNWLKTDLFARQEKKAAE